MRLQNVGAEVTRLEALRRRLKNVRASIRRSCKAIEARGTGAANGHYHAMRRLGAQERHIVDEIAKLKEGTP